PILFFVILYLLTVIFCHDAIFYLSISSLLGWEYEGGSLAGKLCSICSSILRSRSARPFFLSAGPFLLFLSLSFCPKSSIVLSFRKLTLLYRVNTCEQSYVLNNLHTVSPVFFPVEFFSL